MNKVSEIYICAIWSRQRLGLALSCRMTELFKTWQTETVEQTPNSAQLWTKIVCPCEKTINSLTRFVPQLSLLLSRMSELNWTLMPYYAYDVTLITSGRNYDLMNLIMILWIMILLGGGGVRSSCPSTHHRLTWVELRTHWTCPDEVSRHLPPQPLQYLSTHITGIKGHSPVYLCLKVICVLCTVYAVTLHWEADTAPLNG